jgi:hypothetical protein
MLAVCPRTKTCKELLFNLSAKNNVEFLKLNSSQNRRVTGLLTGPCHLMGNLFKLCRSDSPICGKCRMETETVSHIPCECVALSDKDIIT